MKLPSVPGGRKRRKRIDTFARVCYHTRERDAKEYAVTMRWNETAIFCDLDGTLFDHFGKVSPKNRRAIEAYTRAGGLFAIATGRCPSNMMQYLEGVAFNAPCIVLNGAGVYDRKTDRFLFTEFADRDALAAVLRYAQKELPSVNLQVYTPEDILYVSPKETLNVPFWELHKTSRFLSIAEAEAYPWFKALLFGTPEQMRRADRWIEEQGLSPRFDRVFASTDIVPGSYYLELLPKGVNKGSALKTCRSLPPFLGRTMIGVGDYNNDLEMLAEADLAAVPENGHPDALKLADIVLPSNDDDAIAALIERIPEWKRS